MADDLPLMKSVLTPLAKSVLLPLGLSTGISAVVAAIKKNLWISNYSTNNSKWRNGIYNANS